MKTKTQQTECYWLRAHVGSKDRGLGIVFIAGADAPSLIIGRRIFYRLLTWGEDIVMRRDQSIGFSTPAFLQVKNDGVEYIVTYAKETRQMNIAHVRDFTYERNYGQGLQSRARLEDTMTLSNIAGLQFPQAISSRYVADEDPVSTEGPTKEVQPELPLSNPKDRKASRITRRCGCTFSSGIIDRPCGEHTAQWDGVLKSRKQHDSKE